LRYDDCDRKSNNYFLTLPAPQANVNALPKNDSIPSVTWNGQTYVLSHPFADVAKDEFSDFVTGEPFRTYETGRGKIIRPGVGNIVANALKI
jgi:hypothetical protein